MYKWLSLFCGIVLYGSVFADPLSIPHVAIPGETIGSSNYNRNFSAVAASTNNITGDQITNGTITNDDLSGSLAIDATMIEDDAVTRAKLESSCAGDGLGQAPLIDSDAGALYVKVDGPDIKDSSRTGSIEINADTLRVSEGAAGNGIGYSSAVLYVDVDDVTLDLTGTSPDQKVQVKDSGITSAKIADETVTGGEGGNIADDTITSWNITNGTLTSEDIADNTITAADIAADAVAASELADNSVASANIIDGSVTGADIANGTITNSDISSSAAVSSSKISFTSEGTTKSVNNESALTNTPASSAWVTSSIASWLDSNTVYPCTVILGLVDEYATGSNELWLQVAPNPDSLPSTTYPNSCYVSTKAGSALTQIRGTALARVTSAKQIKYRAKAGSTVRIYYMGRINGYPK